MLLAALEDEVNVYLGRSWYEHRVATGPAADSVPPGARLPSFRGCRNGTTPRRLTQQFRAAYAAFDRQDLSDRKFVYIGADGIYLKAGLGTENRTGRTCGRRT